MPILHSYRVMTESAENALCQGCGLCCDGSLFADVLLARNELPPIQAVINYECQDHGSYLQQPCQAFDNHLCKVYEDRPRGCRQFECQLLHDTKADRLAISDAQATIIDVRSQIRHIETLLTQLGNTDKHLPLSFRYEEALAAAWVLSEPEALQKTREELYQAVTQLDADLQDRFRTSSD